jgi:uncharacterized protein YdhG (YjbR/CyaY superfamily)
VISDETMKATKPQTIDEYIALFPIEIQEKLEHMRQTIQNTAPSAEEAIRYEMPTFRLNGKNLVHFAAFKTHIGFYPTPSGITMFKKELTGYIHGKGSVQFPLIQPIPYGLVSRIVSFRVRETKEKMKKRKN